MKLYVAVTDNEWFRFLRSRPALDEVNFWQPGGGQTFRALLPGEPLLFKLHSPENFIVGGGFFETSSRLPCSLAWEVFGEKNGVASFEQMRVRIEKYRRTPPTPHEDYQIGCLILRDPFFFADDSWIPIPTSFTLSIQKGKTYLADLGEGQALWEEVNLRLAGAKGPSVLADAPMYGTPALVRPRLGQGGFRVVITDTYERRCAVTQEKALPALEAAHIRSVSQGGQNRVDNGLLLRADVHRLFDRGYVTVTPDYRFLVSRKLKEDFENGEPYLPFHGSAIWLPSDSKARPGPEFLQWHTNERFKS